jgi:hypothetical protein
MQRFGRVPSGVLDGLPHTLTHLSLLTLEGLAAQDYDVFGTLIHLQVTNRIFIA